MTDIDYAIEILQATNDGNDLTPGELKMVENAANHFLNERGLKALRELYERVVNPKPPPGIRLYKNQEPRP